MSLSFCLSAAPKSLHFKYRGKFSAYTEIIRWEGKNAIYAFFARYVFLLFVAFFLFRFSFRTTEEGKNLLMHIARANESAKDLITPL